jgi:hypothetical protein
MAHPQFPCRCCSKTCNAIPGARRKDTAEAQSIRAIAPHLVHNIGPVTQPAKRTPGERRPARKNDIPWLARLTHPLVFFGAAIAVCESAIAAGLLKAHSDETILKLAGIMAVVAISAIVLVGILVFKKPQHLMLTQQDTIGEEVRVARRIQRATRLMMEAEKPTTPGELFALMAKMEAILSGEDQ